MNNSRVGSSKSIGDMNGGWAYGLKLALVLIPLLCLLNAWQINAIYELKQIVAINNMRIANIELAKNKR